MQTDVEQPVLQSRLGHFHMFRHAVAQAEIGAADAAVQPAAVAARAVRVRLVFRALLFPAGHRQPAARHFDFQLALFPAGHAQGKRIALIVELLQVVRGRNGDRRIAGQLAKETVNAAEAIGKKRVAE